MKIGKLYRAKKQVRWQGEMRDGDVRLFEKGDIFMVADIEQHPFLEDTFYFLFMDLDKDRPKIPRRQKVPCTNELAESLFEEVTKE